MRNLDVFLARDNQSLIEHLNNVAKITKYFAEPFGLTNAGFTVGVLHDLGKFSKAYQNYLQRSLSGEKTVRGEVIHSLQGAKHVVSSVECSLVSDILGNVIASHHGGLFDQLIAGQRNLERKLLKPESELFYMEVLEAYNPSLEYEKISEEILILCKKNDSLVKKINMFFFLHLITKILFSCLVDADRCDAAAISASLSSPDWLRLFEKLEKHINNLSGEGVINSIRNKVFKESIESAKQSQRIFTLSLPTGAGKTLTSLAFALKHAETHKLKRIIYVIPYLSILDQTAITIRNIFQQDEIILEHHSNFELGDEEELKNDEYAHYKLITSRWNVPIILTSMVEFLETILSNKASKLRKFHNMSESVIIFDEFQNLPIKCIHLFNDSINFLSCFGKVSILLCSATQMSLQNVLRPIFLQPNHEIAYLSDDDKKIFERVYISDEPIPKLTNKEISELAIDQIQNNKSTLVILNTKATANEIYTFCKEQDLSVDLFLLSTQLCPFHRKQKLKQISRNLKEKKLTLCISTQLIEAGVDLSFGCVIRSNAGVDSIVQAAGRCNRNKEFDTPQKIFIVEAEEERLTLLPEIKLGQELTKRIAREFSTSALLSEEALKCYYTYMLHEQRLNMDYNVRETNQTVYNLLSCNTMAKEEYKDINNKKYKGLPAAFQSASEHFSVIGSSQTGIIITNQTSLELLENFNNTFDMQKKHQCINRLQQYSINVYRHILLKLLNNGALSLVGNCFYLLGEDWYSEEYGLLDSPTFKFNYVGGFL